MQKIYLQTSSINHNVNIAHYLHDILFHAIDLYLQNDNVIFILSTYLREWEKELTLLFINHFNIPYKIEQFETAQNFIFGRTLSDIGKVTNNEEIMTIKNQINKLLQQPQDDTQIYQELVDLLVVLDKKYFVPLETLQKTKIGLVVNIIAKTYTDNSHIKHLSKALISKWKETAKRGIMWRNISLSPNFNIIFEILKKIINKKYNITYDNNYRVLYCRDDCKNKRNLINVNPDIYKYFDLVIKDMSKLSFEEQVTIFMKTSHFVTTEGAHMTNIIFMNKDAKILDICNIYNSWPTRYGTSKLINKFEIFIDKYQEFNANILYNKNIEKKILEFIK